jgi:uncharacterized membrane-anchored protein
MNLSNTEMLHAAKLRKEERLWLWLRWPLLFLGFCAVVDGVQGYLRLLQLGGEAGALGLKFAMSYTFLSVLFVTYVLTRWKGSRTVRVLFRMLDT